MGARPGSLMVTFLVHGGTSIFSRSSALGPAFKSNQRANVNRVAGQSRASPGGRSAHSWTGTSVTTCAAKAHIQEPSSILYPVPFLLCPQSPGCPHDLKQTGQSGLHPQAPGRTLRLSKISQPVRPTGFRKRKTGVM